MNPIELLRYRQSEMTELFEKLRAPGSQELSGNLRGTLMALSGFGWLPRWLSAGIYRLLALPINPWRGKGFQNGEGANRWFGIPGVGFGYYSLSTIDSPVDHKPALHLNYDRPDNLALFRYLRGEGRMLDDGTFLGRFFWQGKSRQYLIGYFTLVK